MAQEKHIKETYNTSWLLLMRVCVSKYDYCGRFTSQNTYNTSGLLMIPLVNTNVAVNLHHERYIYLFDEY